ncbi:putative ATP-dependent RNA helicase dhr2 [Scheffersomyces spartinae]|uniref:RNA helicase n=1 Tax=Scheffersomyces spartinae TaxID=45513 RepID=A0A9P7VDH6_9ASCO|nr:putative ATP-dependent RNA helicase dhr2 [Scheffersomyces spartinae]KAG7195702.1 putative ATP-dependent RNA helicase dhr2 [Scheffersomyces spartinae]
MSAVQSPVPVADGAYKKRRRRRKTGKNVHEAEAEVEVEVEVATNGIKRQNKKTKFCDDDEESEKEHRVSEEHTDVNEEAGDVFGNDLGKDVIKNASDGIKDSKGKKENVTGHIKSSSKRHQPKVVSLDSDDDDEGDFFNPKNVVSKSQLQARAQALLDIRQDLPIYQHKDEILRHVNENSVTVIIGETGSGKSTQIPQFLMDGVSNDKRQIAVTQPRRVAAATLAKRVSEEHGCQLGQEVGYQVRFSNITSAKTKLKYLTDGMLLREIMIDKNLSKYSTVIIDEAHERTVLTDLVMGFLKQLLATTRKKDLKVIVMSATLNAKLFSEFFNNAPVLFIEGRMFGVDNYYLTESTDDIVDTMIRAVVQINNGEPRGDILCFLPGQEEIDNAVATLTSISSQLPREAPLIVACPLYAALSPQQQLRIFDKLPENKRKVILATNIAETSITVSGVKYVVDSGLRKVKVWRHQLGLSTLLTTPISKASAKQRAGRAGREAAGGKCFRLYLESTFNESLPLQQESEILRNDVIYPVLTLKKLGVDDLLNWTWLEYPGKESILLALNVLYSLGALNDQGKVTSVGEKMAMLPLPPQLSVVLLTAIENGVLAPVLEIIGCLSVDNLILNVNGELRDEVNLKRRQFCPLGTQWGDLILMWEYYQVFKENKLRNWCKEMFFSYKGFKNVERVIHQLKQYVRNITDNNSGDKTDIGDDEDNETTQLSNNTKDIPMILKSFLKGFITNVAVGMPDRSYRTLNHGDLISVHPSSTLFGKPNVDAIMYIEYVYTSKGYARTCSSIELSWVQEVAPHILGASRTSLHQ